ncbi:MAG: hypothetical protein JNM14_12105 [Ferruginibacter sp.]|nr:hypothetical protein [Ferruginibacter sp.]
MPQITTIDEVLDTLDGIIRQSEENNDTAGYFAILYRIVTARVKTGIANNEFADGARMEKLDVIFANRYIDAYFAWKTGKPVTASWQKAFNITTDYWPIVLQHLLMGMNAHINLDLGIAAAQVSANSNINDLQDDFNKINSILSSLVEGVQNSLAKIWPRLKWILQRTKKVDDFMVDFSMQMARDGAWQFALCIAGKSGTELDKLIAERDTAVAEKSKIITHDGFAVSLILGIIRLGERGTVKEKIQKLLP